MSLLHAMNNQSNEKYDKQMMREPKDFKITSSKQKTK